MSSFKLSTFEKVGFGAGDMAVNVVISSFFLIISYFYTDVFGLKPTDMGLMFLIVRILDGIADPIMGTITDKVTTRWGRYRPYLAFLSVPFGISIFLTFSTPDLDYNLKLAYAYATYMLVTLMFTGVTIPYISLIGVLTDDPKERLSANGYRLFFAKIAAFLVSIVVPKLADWSYWEGDKALGYKMSMGAMAILGIALLLFCFFSTKERLEHHVDPKSIWTQMKFLVKNDQMMILCGVCLLGTVGYVIRNSVAMYYAKYYLDTDQGYFLGTGVLAAILAMVASTWITKRYCKLKLFRYSQMAVGVISVAMFYMVSGPDDVVLAFVLYFLLSFVVDLHAPVFWSAIVEAVDYGEVKTGERVAGLAFGGISFFQKAGMGVAGAVVGVLLTFYGYEADKVQTETSLLGITLMLTVIPGVFHFINGSLMMKYHITDEEYRELATHLDMDVDASAAETSVPVQPNTDNVNLVTGAK